MCVCTCSSVCGAVCSIFFFLNFQVTAAFAQSGVDMGEMKGTLRAIAKSVKRGACVCVRVLQLVRRKCYLFVCMCVCMFFLVCVCALRLLL